MGSVKEYQFDVNLLTQYHQEDLLVDNDRDSDDEYEPGCSQWPASVRKQKREKKKKRLSEIGGRVASVPGAGTRTDRECVASPSANRAGSSGSSSSSVLSRPPSRLHQIPSVPVQLSVSHKGKGIAKTASRKSTLGSPNSPGLKRSSTTASTSKKHQQQNTKASRTITELFSMQSRESSSSLSSHRRHSFVPPTRENSTSTTNDTFIRSHQRTSSNILGPAESIAGPQSRHVLGSISSIRMSQIAINTPHRPPLKEIPSSSPRYGTPLTAGDLELEALFKQEQVKTSAHYREFFKAAAMNTSAPTAWNEMFESWRSESLCEIPSTIEPPASLSFFSSRRGQSESQPAKKPKASSRRDGLATVEVQPSEDEHDEPPNRRLMVTLGVPSDKLRKIQKKMSQDIKVEASSHSVPAPEDADKHDSAKASPPAPRENDASAEEPKIKQEPQDNNVPAAPVHAPVDVIPSTLVRKPKRKKKTIKIKREPGIEPPTQAANAPLAQHAKSVILSTFHNMPPRAAPAPPAAPSESTVFGTEGLLGKATGAASSALDMFGEPAAQSRVFPAVDSDASMSETDDNADYEDDEDYDNEMPFACGQQDPYAYSQDDGATVSAINATQASGGGSRPATRQNSAALPTSTAASGLRRRKEGGSNTESSGSFWKSVANVHPLAAAPGSARGLGSLVRGLRCGLLSMTGFGDEQGKEPQGSDDDNDSRSSVKEKRRTERMTNGRSKRVSLFPSVMEASEDERPREVYKAVSTQSNESAADPAAVAAVVTAAGGFSRNSPSNSSGYDHSSRSGVEYRDVGRPAAALFGGEGRRSAGKQQPEQQPGPVRPAPRANNTPELSAPLQRDAAAASSDQSHDVAADSGGDSGAEGEHHGHRRASSSARLPIALGAAAAARATYFPPRLSLSPSSSSLHAAPAAATVAARVQRGVPPRDPEQPSVSPARAACATGRLTAAGSSSTRAARVPPVIDTDTGAIAAMTPCASVGPLFVPATPPLPPVEPLPAPAAALFSGSMFDDHSLGEDSLDGGMSSQTLDPSQRPLGDLGGLLSQPLASASRVPSTQYYMQCILTDTLMESFPLPDDDEGGAGDMAEFLASSPVARQ